MTVTDLGDIPIFDSLAHPTITGDWLERGIESGFSHLVKQAKASNFHRSCAIGMANVEEYQHEEFICQCRPYPELVPIAGVDPTGVTSLPEEISKVKDLGFKGIKIHPRFFRRPLHFESLAEVFQLAKGADLPVFYCSYLHCRLSDAATIDPLYSLVEALKRSPNAKVVLVHGGDVNLLRYAELTRFNDNLLLDLSLTLLKYEGSSLDMDIGFLFRQFDRRICLGTDFPEYTHAQVRRRFEHFGHGVAIGKLENIAHQNLTRFLSL